MNKLDGIPRFIEPGDDQDEFLKLPIYVTRQVDAETYRTHRSLKASLTACTSVTPEQPKGGQNNG